MPNHWTAKHTNALVNLLKDGNFQESGLLQILHHKLITIMMFKYNQKFNLYSLFHKELQELFLLLVGLEKKFL